MTNQNQQKTGRFLLLQMRKDPQWIKPERENFLQFSGLQEEELITLDLYRQPVFDPVILDDFDGFFVGGLSDDKPNDIEIDSHQFPFLSSFGKLLTHAIDRNKPGLLSCGGFMIGSHILGGRVELDPHQKELGCYELNLTEEGKIDILTCELPNSFMIISGHNKSLQVLPSDCTLLGSTKKCKNHIYKLVNSPIYAFQGHPEVTCQGLKERVEPYKEKYFEDKETFERVTSLKYDTSEANSILARFIHLVSKNALH